MTLKPQMQHMETLSKDNPTSCIASPQVAQTPSVTEPKNAPVEPQPLLGSAVEAMTNNKNKNKKIKKITSSESAYHGI